MFRWAMIHSLVEVDAAAKIYYVQKTKIILFVSFLLRVRPNKIINFSHLLKLELLIAMLMLLKSDLFRKAKLD